MVQKDREQYYKIWYKKPTDGYEPCFPVAPNFIEVRISYWRGGKDLNFFRTKDRKLVVINTLDILQMIPIED